jgi:uncharacterized protein YndB with AHSA1/START domain
MSDTYLEMTRIFKAPREHVYRAFTDPDQLARWFGPVGWSVPRASIDMEARVGGQQRFMMVEDAGSHSSPVNAVFTEVVENEVLAGYEDVQGMPGFDGIANLMMRLEFHDDGDGGTRLVLRQGPYSEAVEAGARTGWESSFTKLDTLLAG